MSFLSQTLSKTNQISKYLIPVSSRTLASFNKIQSLKYTTMSSKNVTINATHPDNETAKGTIEKINDDSQYLLPLYGRPNVIFNHGEGAYVYDTAERKYLDFAAGIAVNTLGHNNPIIINAIKEQISKIIHVSNLYHNENPAKLAKLIVESLEKKGKFADGAKVFFGNSGTEANEAAIKFARRYGKTFSQDKNVIISFNHAFHGRSLGALSATPNPKYQDPFSPLLPGFKYSPYNDIEAAKKNIDENVCGVIIEVVQGEGGLTPAKKEFIQYLRKRCDEVNALLIIDEIQTGVGRTGKLYAHQHFDITPDIFTLAKPLGGGIPIGATILSEKVAKTIKPGDHGTTFGGNSLATHVGAAVFETINKPQFLSEVTEKGEYLKKSLKEATKGSKIVKEVRGLGLMIGVGLDEKITPAAVADVCRQQGLLVITCGMNTLRLLPPLIVTKDEIDRGVSIISKSIKYLEDKL
ncbi:acetylornithine and succinylornithine aminotransferase [Piromyces finnis]|uniref:acetylornithine transaminase n=1 Tax=Piromyces finnis TaxID=1754191 RepID=A0A1Y1VPG0_9FUNG|nr:acetylornithine and succinylornithine aminotransferase [Piromyces finnis]|eukprot:ORX61042.1 acetylornithine and succinylornithine aminotransferase [Piromyces finnis]